MSKTPEGWGQESGRKLATEKLVPILEQNSFILLTIEEFKVLLFMWNVPREELKQIQTHTGTQG